VGFEPTNNGFAIRSPNQASHYNKRSYESGDKNLTENLALLVQKFPDLARIIKIWPDLSEHIRTAILTLAQVDTSAGNTKSEYPS
jgi:hypothetical protein